MNNKTHTIADRLNQMAKELDLTQMDIVRRANVDKATLSLYFSGKRIPQTTILMRICDAYGIDTSWMLGSDVPMFRSKSISENAERKLILDYLIDNDDIKTLIECYNKSDEQHKQDLLEYARFLLRKK